LPAKSKKTKKFGGGGRGVWVRGRGGVVGVCSNLPGWLGSWKMRKNMNRCCYTGREGEASTRAGGREGRGVRGGLKKSASDPEDKPDGGPVTDWISQRTPLVGWKGG